MLEEVHNEIEKTKEATFWVNAELLDRGADLEELSIRAESLGRQAEVFEKKANKVQRK